MKDAMTTPHATTAEIVDEAGLTLDEACRVCAVSQHWIVERVQSGLLVSFAEPEPQAWRFDAPTLRRVRRMVQLETRFDAVPELAALVADLQEEIERLRRLVDREAFYGCGLICLVAGLSKAAGGRRLRRTHDRRGGQPVLDAHAASSIAGNAAKYTTSGVCPLCALCGLREL